MYALTDSEKQRLRQGILAAYALPFIDDIEDFIWEAIFTYARDVPLVDPLFNIRSKRLFDVVDPRQSVGWSVKALQATINPPNEFELVIQRADIFKKHAQLGFGPLSVDSPTEELGRALLKHWYDAKVLRDARTQGVSDMRICILLKSKDRRRYAFFEDDIQIYTPGEIEWVWTDADRVGLRGIEKSSDLCVFRWYPNQKQFFERFVLTADTYVFELRPQRLTMTEATECLLSKLPKRPGRTSLF